MLFLGKAQLNRKPSSPVTSLSIPRLSICLKTTEKSGTLCLQKRVYIIQGFHQLHALVPQWVSVHGNRYIEKKKEKQTLTDWLRNTAVSEFWGAGRIWSRQTNSPGSRRAPSLHVFMY